MKTKSDRHSPRIAILGGGLSGLSTALYFQLNSGFDGEVHIYEPRPKYVHDRHWSYWAVEEHAFSNRETINFDSIEVHSGGEKSTFTNGSTPYCVLRSDTVYQSATERLSNDARFKFHMSTKPSITSTSTDAIKLESIGQDDQVFDIVLDSRPTTNLMNALEGFRQWFIGAEIEVSDTSDIGQPRLMDFCLNESDPIGFFYVLPLTATRMLVQLTYFLRPEVAAPENAKSLWQGYVSNRLQCDSYSIVREENGCIPMSLVKPFDIAPNHFAIGAAAGWVRASTGYGFLDIQRAAWRMAQACCTENPEQRDKNIRQVVARSNWDNRFDSIFLDVLKRNPERAPEFFFALFSKCPEQSLIRFLSGTGSWSDRLKIMHALPPTPFLRSIRHGWLA